MSGVTQGFSVIGMDTFTFYKSTKENVSSDIKGLLGKYNS